MTGWRMRLRRSWPKQLYDKARKLAVNCLVLRQRAGAVRRPRGAHRPAGRRDQHGGRVRQAPQDRGRGAEQAAGRRRHRRRARSTPSPTSRAPAGRRRRSPRRCWRRPASPPSAARTSASSAKATSACPTPTRPRISCALDEGVSGDPEGGLGLHTIKFSFPPGALGSAAARMLGAATVGAGAARADQGSAPAAPDRCRPRRARPADLLHRLRHAAFGVGVHHVASRALGELVVGLLRARKVARVDHLHELGELAATSVIARRGLPWRDPKLRLGKSTTHAPITTTSLTPKAAPWGNQPW